VILCEVNTLPAQTAASGEGDNRVFSGIMTAPSIKVVSGFCPRIKIKSGLLTVKGDEASCV
jgi:hypothetical protein